MIDRPVFSDRVRVSGATERLLKTQIYDVIVCPKARLLFCYTLKGVYFFFTERVHTLSAYKLGTLGVAQHCTNRAQY